MALNETLDRKATSLARTALIILFVLAGTFVAEKNALSALSPQDSVQRDDSTQDDDSVKEKKESDSVEYPEDFNARWTRLGYQNEAPARMETSITTFAGKYRDKKTNEERDVQVDLVGAIHIAEKSYYEKLNEIFATYDVVVFEMVADTDGPYDSPEELERKEKENVSMNPLNFVSALQKFVGKALDLTYQMYGIDYSAKNMKRGDCGSVEFIMETISNGDVVDFFLNSYVEARLGQSDGQEFGIAAAILCASDRRLAARRIFAKQLALSEKEDVDAEAAAREGAKNESAVIHFRNKRAISALRRQLDSGADRVAIFYGAAHLPDLAQRLESEFGFQATDEVQWVPAWNMTKD